MGDGDLSFDLLGDEELGGGEGAFKPGEQSLGPRRARGGSRAGAGGAADGVAGKGRAGQRDRAGSFGGSSSGARPARAASGSGAPLHPPAAASKARALRVIVTGVEPGPSWDGVSEKVRAPTSPSSRAACLRARPPRITHRRIARPRRSAPPRADRSGR